MDTILVFHEHEVGYLDEEIFPHVCKVCGIKASFNWSGASVGSRCFLHKEVDMIDINSKKEGRLRFEKGIRLLGNEVIGEYKGGKIKVECRCKFGHHYFILPAAVRNGGGY